MSELRIDPDLGADLECEVGDVLTVTVTGTVTAKSPEGGKTLNVTEVNDYEHGAGAMGDNYSDSTDRPVGKGGMSGMSGMGGGGMSGPRKGKSAVMIMIRERPLGKGK